MPVTYLSIAIFSGLIAFGLIKLDNRARLAMLCLLPLGVINMVILITPWGRAQLALYNAQLYARMGLPQAQATASSLTTGPLMIVSGLFALVVYGLIAWLLTHYRYAFLKQPPPEPDPLNTPLTL